MAVASLPGAANAADLSAIRAELDSYKAIPAFVAAGEPFDARQCMAGKKILTVPFSSSIPFVSTVVTSMVALGKEIGFSYDAYNNTGQRSQWIQGITQGITQQYNLIDLFAPDLLALVPQGRAAAEAGIPIVASHDGGIEQVRPAPFLTVPFDYKTNGQLMAKWAISRTDAKANVLVITALDSYSMESTVAGLKEAFADCEDCKVKYVNVAVSDWSTRIQPNVQSALLADPTIDVIIPVYDSMVPFDIPAVEFTQSKDRVKIIASNGTPFALDFVREGKVDMVIGENLDWVAHAIVDAEMRIICGLPAIANPKIPVRIFDASNAAEAGIPATTEAGYGDSYKAGYRTLWGMN
jgi:ribose transport system substrate-binding protein